MAASVFYRLPFSSSAYYIAPVFVSYLDELGSRVMDTSRLLHVNCHVLLGN
jgi:hypothetical protein